MTLLQLASDAAAGEPNTFVYVLLIFAAIGGLSGFAALLKVLISFRPERRKEQREERTIAVRELEVAIGQWQSLISQIREENVQIREENEELKRQVDRLHAAVRDLELKITEYVALVGPLP